MSDAQYKPTIRIDLRTAMGDPKRCRAEHLPDGDALRMMLQNRETDPVQAWHLHGYRRYLERDFQGAVHALEQALRIRPNHRESLFLKGVCLQLVGLGLAEANPKFPGTVPHNAYQMLSKAEWAFRIVLDLNPGDAEARTYLQGLEALLRPDT